MLPSRSAHGVAVGTRKASNTGFMWESHTEGDEAGVNSRLFNYSVLIAYYHVGLATLKYRNLAMKVYCRVLRSPYLSPGPSQDTRRMFQSFIVVTAGSPTTHRLRTAPHVGPSPQLVNA